MNQLTLFRGGDKCQRRWSRGAARPGAAAARCGAVAAGVAGVLATTARATARATARRKHHGSVRLAARRAISIRPAIGPWSSLPATVATSATAASQKALKSPCAPERSAHLGDRPMSLWQLSWKA